jgi:hypothetical protein
LLVFFVLLPLLLVTFWPFWFFAHWLGLARVTEIERDGKKVGQEKVRGWGKSQRRIEEIARSVADGTWRRPVDDEHRFTEATPPPRTELYLFDPSMIYGPRIAQLELTDRTVRCTVEGTRGDARWTSRRLEIPDLKKRLKHGHQVTVFELPCYSCDTMWPEWVPPSACFHVKGTAQFGFAFVRPARKPTESEYMNLASTCQQWREALDRR